MTLALAALSLCGAAPVFAQNVPRIKAELIRFDGNILTVRPIGEKDTLKVGVRPATRILKEEVKGLSDIQPGQFIGATVNKGPSGAYVAQEVHIFPDALRGAGEGLYPATPGSSHFILDGAVIPNAASQGSNIVSVHFRGLSGEGAGCTGRAPINPLDGCQGNASFALPPAVPVLALAITDKNALKPGDVLAISIMAGPDGRPVTPGLTIESVTTPPVPMPDAPASFSSGARGKKPQ